MTAIDWGHPGFSFVNVVEATPGGGVIDPTGVADSGPGLALAFADLLTSAQVPYLRGTFNIATAAPPAAGQFVYIAPGTTFTGANAASIANVAFVVGQAAGTPAFNPAWYAMADIYWDPANGTGVASDQNSGASALSPVLTFAECVRRWGSRRPQCTTAAQTTLHVMSSQPGASNDCVGDFSPYCPNGMIAMIGTPSAVSVAFLAGAITQISRANPGNDFKVDVSAGASLGVGQLLYNSTQGSYAFILTLAGGIATCTSPLSRGPLTTPQQLPAYAENASAWTSGDTLQAFTLPQIFIDSFTPTGGTLTVSGGGSTQGAAWMSNLRIGDPSGGASTVVIRPTGVAFNMTNVSCRAYMLLDGDNVSEISGLNVANCYFDNNFEARGGAGGVTVYGGGCAVGGSHSTWTHDLVAFRLDFTDGGNAIICTGSLPSFYNAHVAGLLTIDPGVTAAFRAGVANGSLWGAGTCRVYEAGSLINRTGGTFANNLLLATLQLTSASLTTGTAYSPGPDTVVAVKSGDQSVANSTVLVNETSMAVAMGASDTWEVTWKFSITYGTSDGIQLAVVVPTGATLRWTALGIAGPTSGWPSSATSTTSGTGVAVLKVGSAVTVGEVWLTATVIGDGTHAGNITLQFAQNTSNGTNTTIQGGAGMVATRAQRQLTPGIALTSANLDTYGSLSDPPSGARIAN